MAGLPGACSLALSVATHHSGLVCACLGVPLDSVTSGAIAEAAARVAGYGMGSGKEASARMQRVAEGAK